MKGSEGTGFVEQIVNHSAPLTRYGRAIFYAGSALLLISISVNGLLAWRLQSILHSRVIAESSRILQIGATASPFAARGLDGRMVMVTYAHLSKPTVLYVYTPTCPWCVRNLENLKALIRAKESEYRFLGISLSSEGLQQYLAEHALELPTFTGLSEEVQKTYKLQGTPETIVISPEGRVLQNWMGAYSGRQKSEVEAFFHVSLPGLRELPKAEAANEKVQTAPQAN
jgi:peroxiredoxin